MNMKVEQILNYWFGDYKDDGECFKNQTQLWFGKDDEVDRYITEQFRGDIDKLIAGDYDDWLARPKGRLAAIIVLDQFSRQVYRNQAQAFAYDSIARNYCLQGIELGHDRQLRNIYRYFFYLPLMHAEDKALQVECVKQYQQLLEAAPQEHKHVFEAALDYAQRHKKIIDQFGRYPHRNTVLGRLSTPQEKAFLTEPGSSF